MPAVKRASGGPRTPKMVAKCCACEYLGECEGIIGFMRCSSKGSDPKNHPSGGLQASRAGPPSTGRPAGWCRSQGRSWLGRTWASEGGRRCYVLLLCSSVPAANSSALLKCSTSPGCYQAPPLPVAHGRRGGAGTQGPTGWALSQAPHAKEAPFCCRGSPPGSLLPTRPPSHLSSARGSIVRCGRRAERKAVPGKGARGTVGASRGRGIGSNNMALNRRNKVSQLRRPEV